jgi:DNA-binding XRE family transcriptional regulator
MYSYNEGEDSTMTTGKIIKQLRKEHHLTQEKLGEIVGVQKSADTVSIRKGIVSIVTHF